MARAGPCREALVGAPCFCFAVCVLPPTVASQAVSRACRPCTSRRTSMNLQRRCLCGKHAMHCRAQQPLGRLPPPPPSCRPMRAVSPARPSLHLLFPTRRSRLLRLPGRCRPSKVQEGMPHPDPIVETASLASVQPPDIKYKHHLQVRGARAATPRCAHSNHKCMHACMLNAQRVRSVCRCIHWQQQLDPCSPSPPPEWQVRTGLPACLPACLTD